MRALALFTILVVADASQGGRSVEILGTGSYHGDEVSADAPGRWFALVREGNGAALRAVRVSIAIERDEIADEEGETTGKRVDVSPSVDAMVLVRGLRALKAGPLATTLIDTAVDVGASAHARLRTRSYELSMRCVEVTPVEGQRQELCDLLLRSQGAEQIVFTYGTYLEGSHRIWTSEHAPVVHWAGDIDADGRLDLLLDTSGHYNVREMRLFLSSAAKDGALVGDAAPFTSVGC